MEGGRWGITRRGGWGQFCDDKDDDDDDENGFWGHGDQMCLESW